MAGPEEINVNAATAAASSEPDGTLTLKEEHKNDTESFSWYKTFSNPKILGNVPFHVLGYK